MSTHTVMIAKTNRGVVSARSLRGDERKRLSQRHVLELQQREVRALREELAAHHPDILLADMRSLSFEMLLGNHR